jgi:tetratricopeptide (TPR) repeat protein
LVPPQPKESAVAITAIPGELSARHQLIVESVKEQPMETPTPSLREQGIQALREGNLDGAVDYLARAVMADGEDAEAQAFLGVAYSQKGLHAQATRALQTAISLQPQEARYRFNLGVAMESAGDAAGAAEAYRETLRLNPQHAQSRTRLQGLGAAAPAASAPAAPAAPAAAPEPGSTWFGSQPPAEAAPAAAPVADTPPGGMPWLAAQPAAHAETGPPGTVRCPNCKQWSKPGLSCEWCSGSLKPAPSQPSAPWLQSSYGAGTGPGGEVGAVTYEEDRFDVGQAFKDLGQTLIAPSRFFTDQEGREGLKAPMAFWLVYCVLTFVAAIPIYLIMGMGMMIPFLLIFLAFGFAISTLLLFIWAGIVHGVSRMFGGQGGYSGSFRACAYASGPWLVIGLLAGLLSAGSMPKPAGGFPPGRLGYAAPQADAPRIVLAQYPGGSPYGGRGGVSGMPGAPGSSPFGANPMNPFAANPLALVLNLVGMVYYFVMLGMGVFHIHRLSPGGAVGVSIVSGLAALVILVGIVVLFSALLAAAFMGMRGGG